MANRAYAGVWVQGFSEATMLEHFAALLSTVPFSASRPGFAGLVVRAVDPSEAPLLDRDLRLQPMTALELLETAREYQNPDCCYETAAWWDLWDYDAEQQLWEQRPHRVEIFCHGEEYDGGAFAENGHFHMDLGFEYLFTGHAGLLGFDGRTVAAPQHAAEAAFLDAMADSDNLRTYRAKTCENISALLNWTQRIAKALPVKQWRLWSEGEENFEARLDEIVATR